MGGGHQRWGAEIMTSKLLKDTPGGIFSNLSVSLVPSFLIQLLFSQLFSFLLLLLLFFSACPRIHRNKFITTLISVYNISRSPQI